MKARDLARLLDFIYRGQVQVYRSDLQDFLHIAEVLKVKGVTWGETRQENDIDHDRKQPREFIVQTNKAQDTPKIRGNELNIHTSEQLLEEEINKAFNIHAVSSSPSSPLSLDT